MPTENEDITDLLSLGSGAPPADIDELVRLRAHEAVAGASVREAPAHAGSEGQPGQSRWTAWQRTMPVAAVFLISAGVVTQLWQRPSDVEEIAVADSSVGAAVALSADRAVDNVADAMSDTTIAARSRQEVSSLRAPDATVSSYAATAEIVAERATENAAVQAKGGAASVDSDPRERLSQLMHVLDLEGPSEAQQELINWQEDFPQVDVLEYARGILDADAFAGLEGLVDSLGATSKPQ